MRRLEVTAASKPFTLVCDTIAADKSISHRCAMFALLSDQRSEIRNFLQGEDTLNSLRIVEQLGATVERVGSDVTISPPATLSEPDSVLDCGNAGTGMRLFCGLLAGIEGHFVLTGDKYLRGRPMRRVTDPLRAVGAKIGGRAEGNLAPLCISGGALEPFRYQSPIDSAQVKSALILAALRAKSPSYYKESFLSRDHTERMLRGMGVEIEKDPEGWIRIMPPTSPLRPLNITVPADPSSGFFFAVAAAITPGAETRITNVSLNPTRIEAYRALERMGADITFVLKEDIYEPIGDITVRYQEKLRSITVDSNIPWLIDELPALAIAMATAEGSSTVRNAEELRVKESDRISATLEGLQRAGIQTREWKDGYDIVGGTLQKAHINSHGDHRIAMAFAIAGVRCGMHIEDIACIETSFPNFYDILQEISEVKDGN